MYLHSSASASYQNQLYATSRLASGIKTCSWLVNRSWTLWTLHDALYCVNYNVNNGITDS